MLSKFKELTIQGERLNMARRDLRLVCKERNAAKVIAKELSNTLCILNLKMKANEGNGKGCNVALAHAKASFVEMYKQVMESRERDTINSQILQIVGFIKTQSELVKKLDAECEAILKSKE